MFKIDSAYDRRNLEVSRVESRNSFGSTDSQVESRTISSHCPMYGIGRTIDRNAYHIEGEILCIASHPPAVE